MVVIQLGFSSFQIAVVGQFSKIQIFPWEAFLIDDTLFEVFDLVNLLNLFCEFGNHFFHLVFLLD